MEKLKREATELPFKDPVTVSGVVVKRDTGYSVTYPLAIEYRLGDEVFQEVLPVSIDPTNRENTQKTIDSYVGKSAELDIATVRNPLKPDQYSGRRVIRMYLGGELISELFPGLAYETIDQRAV